VLKKGGGKLDWGLRGIKKKRPTQENYELGEKRGGGLVYRGKQARVKRVEEDIKKGGQWIQVKKGSRKRRAQLLS